MQNSKFKTQKCSLKVKNNFDALSENLVIENSLKIAKLRIENWF